MKVFYCFIILYFTLYIVKGQEECPEVPAIKEDRRQNKGSLKIAAFNTEWLFDGVSDPSGVPWNGVGEADQHLNNIAGVIERGDADIWILGEVENCSMLKKLAEHEKLESAGYKPYLVQGTDSALEQDVALLTKIDPTSDLQRTSARQDYPVTVAGAGDCGYTGTPSDTAVSKHFYTTFSVNAPEGGTIDFLLIGAHLKAKFDERSCAQRQAQVKILADLALEEGLNKGLDVVIGGDLNDFDDTCPDAKDSTSDGTPLAILRDADPSKEGEELMNTACPHIFQSQRSTNSFNSQIDHIFVTKGLFDLISSVEVDSTHDLSKDAFTSDHYPVIAAFSLEDVPPVALYVGGGVAGASLLAIFMKYFYTRCKNWQRGVSGIGSKNKDLDSFFGRDAGSPTGV